MIILKQYQENAVVGLAKETWSLLENQGRQKKIVFKAPTGAGKTVVMAKYMANICDEINDKLELKTKKIAFIWFAPNQLHLQSYSSILSYFDNLRTIKPIQYEDITDEKIQANEVLFINWQSVNKEKNIYIREDEYGKNLITYVNNTYADDTEIICILDEAHYHASGKKAKELLSQIGAKIEMDVSATPLFKSDYQYIIKRQEVIKEEMIKKNVILNSALDHYKQKNISLNQYLLEQAIKQRDEIAKAYQDIGADINPLLLIQLPNDKKKESVLDKKIIDEIILSLKSKEITTNNHKLAVWLSNRKDNLENIEKLNSITDILLFKQAIALGWDCPRSAVLLIFREINQEHFGIQTVGRILRMPQQKHYSNVLLNNGYVYTNLSKKVISIIQEDIDYIVQNKTIRISNYKSIGLNSSYINTRLVRNRLNSKFRICLYEAGEKFLNVNRDLARNTSDELYKRNKEILEQNFIQININKIEIPIPKNVELSVKIGVTIVNEMEQFAKTYDELNLLFRQFCRDNVGNYAKVESSPVLELALISFFIDYFSIGEENAIKIILYQNNRNKFIELIDLARKIYQELQNKKALKSTKQVENNKWDVPKERIYNEHYSEQISEKHALMPFYEQKRASNPEKEFVKFLEINKPHIEWWYKNGEKNKEDFAITYTDTDGSLRSFYVDFVIKLKNNKIALFDTKTINSEKEFVNKHNALIKYIEKNTKKEKELLGGVIIPDFHGQDIMWKYCKNEITNAKDLSQWIFFEPSMMKK